jgi:hypothetical protein
MKVISDEDRPRVVPDLNLLEVACSDCAKQLRKSNSAVYRILHRFDLTGELVESVTVYEDGSEEIHSQWTD